MEENIEPVSSGTSVLINLNSSSSSTEHVELLLELSEQDDNGEEQEEEKRLLLTGEIDGTVGNASDSDGCDNGGTSDAENNDEGDAAIGIFAPA